MRTPEEIRKAVLAADYSHPYERHDDEMVRLAVREAVSEAATVAECAIPNHYACEISGRAIRTHFKDYLS